MTSNPSSAVNGPDSSLLLREAAAAIRDGRHEQARDLLKRQVRQQPDHAQSWLWLAHLSQDPRQARAYIRQALRLDPRNRQAIQALRQIATRPAQGSVAPDRAYVRTLRRWLGIWLLIAALVVIVGGFGMQAWALRGSDERDARTTAIAQPSPSATATVTPTATPSIPERVSQRLPDLQSAWEARDWHGAIDLLNEVTLLDSQYPGLRDARCDTLVHWARDLVADGQINEAYELYRRAYPLCQERTDVTIERHMALAYLSGKWRYDHGYWWTAAEALQPVYEVRPDYAQVQSLLYTSYISASHELMDGDRLSEAQQAVKAALLVEPDSDTAQTLLRQIQDRLAQTPTSAPSNTTGRRIEVNISEQRMYVWQGDTLVYKWVCSTGEPGRDTAAGHFRILDKIPEAWASTWSLRMPYWLGIYWAGSLENGIHALPINPDGTMLWAGYQGSRVSFGCVILSTENARTLYNWAPVGTPVWIHY